jgi:peptidoglycan/xylan/chitin deacetylase (PgdA/CDA1 family)
MMTAAALLLTLTVGTNGASDVITRLPTRAKVVALTFDACEADRVAHLDQEILAALRLHPVPFTVFAGGRFVRDNADSIAALSRLPGVRIENHSWSHPRDLRLLSDAEVIQQISLADDEIERVTGVRPTLFRFPGGNVDERVAHLVTQSGHRIVHWRWAEGDPDRGISAAALVAQTLERTAPGDILILHINGRGWHTAEALPELIDGLESRGFRFVDLLTELDKPSSDHTSRRGPSPESQHR